MRSLKVRSLIFIQVFRGTSRSWFSGLQKQTWEENTPQKNVEWPLGLTASVSDPWLTERWELSLSITYMTIFNNIPMPNSFHSDIASAGMRSNWCCAKDKSLFFLFKFCPNSIYPRSPIIPSKQITSIDLFWFLPAGSLAKTYFGSVQIFVELGPEPAFGRLGLCVPRGPSLIENCD